LGQADYISIDDSQNYSCTDKSLASERSTQNDSALFPAPTIPSQSDTGTTNLPPINKSLSTSTKTQEQELASSSLPSSSSSFITTETNPNSIIESTNNQKNGKITTKNENFVKLNLRNKTGSCRGARNLRFQNRQKKWKAERRQQNGQFNKDMNDEMNNLNDSTAATRKTKATKSLSISNVIDPIDDFLDGTFTAKAEENKEKRKGSQKPSCPRHDRECKILIVKKNTTGNKGRKFYVCSMPKGEQCNFFQWEDDTLEAAQKALLNSSSHSGFIARQVSSHVDRFKSITLPELRDMAKQRGLQTTGLKKSLIVRLTVWVRDEICSSMKIDDNTQKNIEKGTDAREVCNTMTLNDLDVESSVADSYGDSDESDESDDEYASDECDELEICAPHTSLASTSKSHDDKNLNLSPLHRSLFDLFGHSKFRSGQEWAVRRVLANKKTLLVAPTGSGKSLCYALPAALMDGLCIVVSPLVSLMEDQLRHLPPRIPSTTLSGSMSTKKMATIIDDLVQNRYKILFVSPERLASAAFRRLLRPRYNTETKRYERQLPPVSLLCIDEAHCLSQWGHNFRSSYLRLRSLVLNLEPRSVLALTATASPPVIRDICRTLCMEPPNSEVAEKCDIPCSGKEDNSVLSSKSNNNADVNVDYVKVLNCNRDNINVAVQFLNDEDQRLQMLLNLLREPSARIKESKDRSSHSSQICMNHDEMDGCLSKGSVIIYVWRQKDAEIITEQIHGSGLLGGVVCYHGGMDAHARSKAQEKFMRGKFRICVATVAFGLGINKSNVRGVVHLCLPPSPEHYLQEIGRAGRDGAKAQAVALVLENEISQKHSLSFSDKLSKSQIVALLTILRELTSTAMKDNSGAEFESNTMHVDIALPIVSAVQSTDCKEETIQTILSILEDDNSLLCKKMLTIEGIIPDSATIILKRQAIEKLANTEPIARCICSCGIRVDSRSGTLSMGASYSDQRGDTAMQRYSFGVIEFSITKCTRLLGVGAEPRHVYAALRRLQSIGELELSFTDTGKSVHLKMNKDGINFFCKTEGPDSCEQLSIRDDAAFDFLVDSIYQHCLNQDVSRCSKVLEIHHILRQVSLANARGTNKGSKSESELEQNSGGDGSQLFQKMINHYFNDDEERSTIIERNDLTEQKELLQVQDNDSTTLSFLSSDVWALLQYKPMEKSTLNELPRVIFAAENFLDYTSLRVTKILHGITSPSTPVSEWYSHPLWGKWKSYNFISLLSEVNKIIVIQAQDYPLIK